MGKILDEGSNWDSGKGVMPVYVCGRTCLNFFCPPGGVERRAGRLKFFFSGWRRER